MYEPPSGVATFVLTAVLMAGCGQSSRTDVPTPSSPESSSRSGQGPLIAIATNPDPPGAGGNEVTVTLRDANGNPIGDANVVVVLSMPAMPSMGMPAMRTVAAMTSTGDGKYTGTAQLSMTGTWNVTIEASRNGEPLVRRNLSLIAR